MFEEGTVNSDVLMHALNDNFADSEELMYMIRNEAPKFGRDEEVSAVAVKVLDMFADAALDLVNERGGVYRAGTGSAMYYLWHAASLGATAGGRREGEPLPANFSPSLFVKGAGPLSMVRNLALPNLKRVANGGPVTLELHDTVFRNEESISKVAMLVKTFIDLGGHQLQLNAVNREAMLEAQKQPEAYRNMIVRVWGWSGYFVELDKEYQDQIISRTEFMI